MAIACELVMSIAAELKRKIDKLELAGCVMIVG